MNFCTVCRISILYTCCYAEIVLSVRECRNFASNTIGFSVRKKQRCFCVLGLLWECYIVLIVVISLFLVIIFISIFSLYFNITLSKTDYFTTIIMDVVRRRKKYIIYPLYITTHMYRGRFCRHEITCLCVSPLCERVVIYAKYNIYFIVKKHQKKKKKYRTKT